MAASEIGVAVDESRANKAREKANKPDLQNTLQGSLSRMNENHPLCIKKCVKEREPSITLLQLEWRAPNRDP